MPFNFGDVSLNSGDWTNAQCAVSKGDTPLDIYWKFENKTINIEDNILINRQSPRVSTLTIDSVQSQHRGLFTCYAKNPAGLSYFSAELSVNGI